MSATAVLAIDQGTSATKAVVVCPERGLLAEADVPVDRARFDGGCRRAGSRGALGVGGRCGPGRAGRRPGSRSTAVAPGQPGRDRAGVGPGQRRPLITRVVSWQDRRAADVVCRRLAPRGGRAARPHQRPPARPVLRRPEAGLAREQRDPATASVTTTRRVAPAPAHRRVRHRRRDGLAHAAARPRRRSTWSPTAARAVRPRRRPLPAVVACDGSVGDDRRVRRSHPRRRASSSTSRPRCSRRAAWRRARPSAPTAPGAFLLANAGAAAHPVDGRPATSVAWRLAGAATYCLDGQVYTVARRGPLAAATSGCSAGPADLDRLARRRCPTRVAPSSSPRSPGSARRCGRRETRGALTGLRWHDARPPRARAVVEGIAAQVAPLAAAAAARPRRPRSRRCGSTAGSPAPPR